MGEHRITCRGCGAVAPLMPRHDKEGRCIQTCELDHKESCPFLIKVQKTGIADMDWLTLDCSTEQLKPVLH